MIKYEEKNGKTFIIEDKQDICDAICEALRHTSAAGSPGNNALKEIRYVKMENGDEYAVPIFEDGNGEPSECFPKGYYAINITGDSGIGIWLDVTNQFIRKMW